jgi:putative ATP-dependent endonuclease of OLD family
LDEIVVLVGPNNVGKSLLLRAYEIAMSDGSNASKLSIDDFPNRKCVESNLPQIELHTVIYDERVGA